MDGVFQGLKSGSESPDASGRGEHQEAYFDIPTIFLDDRDNPDRTGRYAASSPDARAYMQYGTGVAQVHVQEKGTQTCDGTGFFVTSDGVLATDLHLINERRNGGSITVTTTDGGVHSALVVKEDPAHDLALLQVQPRYANESFKPLKLASNSAAKANEHVTALGFPAESAVLHISPGTYNSAFPLNKIHLTQGFMKGELRDRVVSTSEMAVMEGNSGGPVLNRQGEVVGIVDMRNRKKAVVISTPVEDLNALIRQYRSVNNAEGAGSTHDSNPAGNVSDQSGIDLNGLQQQIQEIIKSQKNAPHRFPMR